MRNEAEIVYHIPRKVFVKYIRHSLNTTLTEIQKKENITFEINTRNKSVYNIKQNTENSYWKYWLEDNNIRGV